MRRSCLFKQRLAKKPSRCTGAASSLGAGELFDERLLEIEECEQPLEMNH